MAKPTEFQRGDHVEMGRGLLNTINENLDELAFDEGSLYRYVPKHGLWFPVDDDDCSRILQGFAGLPCSYGRSLPLKVQIQDVKGAIKLAHDMARRAHFFAEAPIGLSFANGFVEVTPEGVKLKPLRRQNLARAGYTWDYDPSIKSPAFLKFIDDIFRDDADKAEKIAFIQELFGASLVRVATRYQKCALCIGDGENGKDTLIDVLQSVFPTGTVAAIPPHRWGHEYSRARLAGVWLNVIGELPEVELEASEAFKSIVVGGSVDARNPFGRVFDFRPIAGHVFAANSNMGTPDFTHGFFRRFGVIRFNRRFGPEERDPEIKERLIATEGHAIIMWLIEGAARIVARGKYVLPASHTVELETWRRDSDQVALFIEAKTRRLVEGEKGHAADALYSDFVEWAEANGHRRMTSTTFGKRAKAYLREKGFPDAVRSERGINYPVTTRPKPNRAGLMHGKKSNTTSENLSNIHHIKKNM